MCIGQPHHVAGQTFYHRSPHTDGVHMEEGAMRERWSHFLVPHLTEGVGVTEHVFPLSLRDLFVALVVQRVVADFEARSILAFQMYFPLRGERLVSTASAVPGGVSRLLGAVVPPHGSPESSAPAFCLVHPVFPTAWSQKC